MCEKVVDEGEGREGKGKREPISPAWPTLLAHVGRSGRRLSLRDDRISHFESAGEKASTEGKRRELVVAGREQPREPT